MVMLKKRTKDVSAFHNGTFKETFDCLAVSRATDTEVWATLEQSGGGDLTMQFSTGDFVLDCTATGEPSGICEVQLTVGTGSIPKSNYIYIPLSTKVLTASTTGWASEEHIKVAYMFVPDAAYVGSDGPYINQNWNDHLSGTDNMGHLTHIGQWIREQGATWFSGVGGNGTDNFIDLQNGDTEAYIKTSAGVISQHHRHTFAAKDTSSGDDVHIVNHPTTPYLEVHDLATVQVDSQNVSTNGRFYNIVLGGVANKGGTYDPLVMNLPSGSYNNLTDAVADTDGYNDYSMPREFFKESSTGFYIAIITLKRALGTNVVTVENTVDLRGRKEIGGVAGGTGGGSVFTDATFKITDDVDTSKILDFDVGTNVSTATTRTITMDDADVDLADVNKNRQHMTNVSILDPNGAYGVDTQIPILRTHQAITVTRIEVSLDATGNQVAGDLKWADDLTAFTNATVINAFDTTSGVRSDSSISSGSVAADKWMYLQFDSQPSAAITFMNINIYWDYD